MSSHQCPVCNADLPQDLDLKHCVACGWYLEPLSIPMTNSMAQFLAAREEIQLTWARDIWQKGQLKAELEGIHRDITMMVKQLTRGYKERSELYAQLLQLREVVDTHLGEIVAHTASPAIAPPSKSEPDPVGDRPNGQGVQTSPELMAAVEQMQQQLQQQWKFLQTHLPTISPSLTTSPSLDISPGSPGVIATSNGSSPSLHGSADDDDLELSTFAPQGNGAPSPFPPGEDASSNEPQDESNPDNSKLTLSYRKLHKLLAAGKWAEADRETTKLMLKVAGRSTTSWLRIEDIENFPAGDLQAIDRLWVAYSQERFGFSRQKELWLDIADGSTSQVEAWCQFGDSLGWLSKKKNMTGINAPAGHFPSCSSVGVWWSSGLFLQVMESCHL